MKLATFEVDGEELVGALEGEELVVIDIPSMRALFELGTPVQEKAQERKTSRRYALADVKLKAPIIPKKIYHTAGNYAEHAQEGDRSNWVAEIKPWIVFFQNVDAIIGPDDAIVYPEHLTKELDYELELCAIIAKPGKFISEEDAKDYIGGYVIFNDITARDIQRREMQSSNFVFSKSIDTFCPFGPWIVTADEIPDPYNLALELRVNGEKRQVSNSSHMSVTLPQLIAKFSPTGYSAGDILTTGTVSGVAAFSADPQAWYLKPGDKIEAEIEKIGVLRNHVVSWKDAYGVDAPEFEGF
ncbi:2-keto-4-pentenoate hydratase/2-oxohepta-3-ene-1,7-dioic acid hydratase in catechol pathway [Breoghania corrubedonensis]|uniref:2-keto-4-pentenoate hydratase/2-oxohepta-3-ene-1,7-dioic acid hydratase in catechol pathway n=1 Tax=Breoghania corrubedonensis TaxID=665038 RepID=A0A2T5VHF5_9HYPH|nr:fumarylacetoacetate hydrolase family protein [Breoghania corrubedonensis]PTW63191.1 2-keto-4-pentenoate hydratase/2-oxohepta-3-ene-1,7-dioic acid hydratase in catechol pathway [Breoghania corrubedonensis]